MMDRILLLLIVSGIALSFACASATDSDSEQDYIIKKLDLNEEIEILNYYPVDRDLGIRGLVATRQELIVKGKKLELTEFHSSIEAANACGDDVFLLLSGNHGRFVARLCQDGSIEYVCSVPFDYLGVDFGLIWSLEVVPGKDNTITSTVYYGCPGEYCCKEPECEKLTVSVSAFDFGISASCIPALQGYQVSSAKTCPPQKLHVADCEEHKEPELTCPPQKPNPG